MPGSISEHIPSPLAARYRSGTIPRISLTSLFCRPENDDAGLHHHTGDLRKQADSLFTTVFSIEKQQNVPLDRVVAHFSRLASSNLEAGRSHEFCSSPGQT